MNVEAIQAGATVKFNIPGRNFRLIETTGPVNVTFYRRGAEIAESVQVEAGYSEKWEQDSEGFEQVEFYSATAQTIKFAVRMESSVSYDRAVGNVAVTNVNGVMAQSTPTIGTTVFAPRPTNTGRRYLFVQNQSPSADLWMNLTTNAAVGNGIKIPPGGSMEFQGFVPTGSVSLIASAAGTPVYIMEGPY